jgi:hypothetical protein
MILLTNGVNSFQIPIFAQYCLTQNAVIEDLLMALKITLTISCVNLRVLRQLQLPIKLNLLNGSER